MLAGCGKAYPFQSTFPRGERLTVSASPALTPRFQSTFPRGERRGIITRNTNLHNFNPRSLVGNDECRMESGKLLRNFNPRSLVGNDGSWLERIRKAWNFNPRSLVGNDYSESEASASKMISIHVPSWGTTERPEFTAPSWTFQSTFPRGERPTGQGSDATSFTFQSTFPRGERRRRHRDKALNHKISIHVPSWGTTVNFHKYSLFFYAINIIFLLFIIPSLFSLVLFMLLF